MERICVHCIDMSSLEDEKIYDLENTVGHCYDIGFLFTSFRTHKLDTRYTVSENYKIYLFFGEQCGILFFS